MRAVWEALRSGPEQGILVCDFDGTLTESGSSMHAVSKILGTEADFTRARDGLYQKYGWLLSADEGKSCYENTAEKWWKEQMELYVRFGITRELLLKASRTLPPREKCVELLRRCLEYKVPVWIVSAGIANVIEYWLDGQGFEKKAFHILANRIFYDGEQPSGFGSVITMWNKPKVFFRESDIDLGRKLVFLGNHPGDVKWRTEKSESFLIDIRTGTGR